MRTFKLSPVAALAIGLAAACGGSDDGGPEPASLIGTWVATKAEFVDASNAARHVDVVAAGGSVVLTLTESGSWTLTVSPAGGRVDETAGTWSSLEGELTLSFAPPMVGEMQFDMKLSASTLTLEQGHKGYDFDDDGIQEEARLKLILVRQP